MKGIPRLVGRWDIIVDVKIDLRRVHNGQIGLNKARVV